MSETEGKEITLDSIHEENKRGYLLVKKMTGGEGIEDKSRKHKAQLEERARLKELYPSYYTVEEKKVKRKTVTLIGVQSEYVGSLKNIASVNKTDEQITRAFNAQEALKSQIALWKKQGLWVEPYQEADKIVELKAQLAKAVEKKSKKK